MSEGAVGFVVLLLIAVVASVVAHRLVRSYFAGSVLAAGAATVLFQAVVSLQQGYVDPFFPIALVVGGVIALVVALLIGAMPGSRRHDGSIR